MGFWKAMLFFWLGYNLLIFSGFVVYKILKYIYLTIKTKL